LAGIILKKRSTPHGVKIPESKPTGNKPIETLPFPKKAIVPLHQNLGVPCEPLVKKGDSVKTGEKIGDSESYVSAPIHSPISGEVTGFTRLIGPTTGRLTDAIIITADGRNTWEEPEAAKDIAALSRDEIIALVREAGIVGLGGATFPSHIKLSPPEGKKIDTLILNGCECEPFITSDHRIMLEYGEKILLGLGLSKKVFKPDRIYIAIEDNKQDAIDHMEELVMEMGLDRNIRIVPLKSKYPMGGEKILIKVITGREVPSGGLPLDVGAVVQSISTVKAMYDAIFDGKPLIERVVTVTGLVERPGNLCVRFGTPLREVIDYCGGIKKNVNEILLGGPMMGTSCFDLDFPVTKGVNCILAKESTPVKEENCIRCGRCLDACSMDLIPTNFVKYVKNHDYAACKKASIADCIECGACAYSCPAHIPIVEYIKIAKGELANKKRIKK